MYSTEENVFKMSSNNVLSAAPGLDLLLSTLIYDELTKDDQNLMKSPSQKSIFSDSDSNNSLERSSVIVENEFYNQNSTSFSWIIESY